MTDTHTDEQKPYWLGRMATKAVPLTDAWIALRTKERREQVHGLIDLEPTVWEIPRWVKALCIVAGFLVLCIGAAIYGATAK